MDINITLNPGSSVAQILLAPGEELTAEGGAMIAMSADMDMETTTYKKGKSGILKGLKRLVAGEGLFMNHYTAGPNGGDVWLSTTLQGDMMVHELQGEKLIVQGGSFVACDKDIDMDIKWGGMKSMFGGEGLFWLNLEGQGKVILNSFGTIYPVEVDGEYIIDSGHIVAYQETLDYSLTKAGGSWLNSFFGGEGIVSKFKGKGTVWCQSHNPKSFGGALTPFLKPKKQ